MTKYLTLRNRLKLLAAFDALLLIGLACLIANSGVIS